MPALTLADAVSSSSSALEATQLPCENIRWLECFTDKEMSTRFCEATDPSGNLESNSSENHKAYQDRIRAIALRKEGRSKNEIAELLGRPPGFVKTWWQKEEKQVPKPPGVHEYLKTEFWRDIEIVRGFAKNLSIYDDALNTTEWVQPMADGREFKNGGGYRLKYDKEGRMRPQGNQNAKDGVVPGKLPQLDKVVQKVMSTQNIDDRVLKRPGLLWYPDGNSDAIVHRHEAWTALLSFGSPRILTIDNHPVLLRDGDLIVFGTQRHGVPKMCNEGSTFDEYGGRMSVVMFFMPTGQQAQGSAPWRAITDGPSRKMTAMLRDFDLGQSAQAVGLENGSHAEEVKQLTDLGFNIGEAAAALRATNFDVPMAVEALLNGNGPALLLDSDASDICCFSKSSQIEALYKRLSELQSARELLNRGKSSSSSSCEETHGEDDAALAARLQREEECPDPVNGDWEEMAILEQLEDLERRDTTGNSQVALAAQFAQYEEMLDAKDAEEWDGRGDLMVREWRRQHLHIEQQEPSTVYAYGCLSFSEKSFFELLSLHSIRVLYDFRPDAERTGPKHFKPSYLDGLCKRHAVHYRHAELGRETAYGVLNHLKSDEGRNLLAELVWWARRKRTAFLGLEDDWRKDPRLAIAARLREAGHTVLHVASDGSTEEHPKQLDLPDFIAGQEARLRMLEKQRASGDIQRPQKSSVSRSTESVAQRLNQPQKEIDVAAELRKANTQAELCRIQRRMADLQRKSEASDSKAGLGPKLLNVNKWVKADADVQKEHLLAGKTKDGKDKDLKVASLGAVPSYSWTGSGGTIGGNPDFSVGHNSSSSSAATKDAWDVSSLEVECIACGRMLPWELLELGDGRCEACINNCDSGKMIDASPKNIVIVPEQSSVECGPSGVVEALQANTLHTVSGDDVDTCGTAQASGIDATKKMPVTRWTRRRLERERTETSG